MDVVQIDIIHEVNLQFSRLSFGNDSDNDAKA